MDNYVLTADFRSNNAPEVFTESLIKTGFGVIKNHPIDSALVNSVYSDWQQFFALAEPEKMKYLYSKEKQDGYFPFRSENAKGYSTKDLKEFFMYYTWGQYPSSLSDKTKILYQQMNSLAGTLLTWIEQHTPEHIRKDFSTSLANMIDHSPKTVMRILHYPPLTGSEEPNAIRAAAHEDIDLLTLLPAATATGLQVKDAQGKWHNVECDPGTIVVNVGDMLQLCSQKYYRSTTHQVVNPDGDAAKKSRLSMPLFLHPKNEVRLSETHTAGSYLLERLRELGLV